MKHLRIIEENIQERDAYYYVEKRFLWKWKKYSFKAQTTLSQRCNRYNKLWFHDLDKLLLVLKEYKVIYYKHYKLEPYINDNEDVEFYCQKAGIGGKLKDVQEFLDNYRTIIFEK